LEEIGEFQGSDVAASFPDFALKIADDATEVVEVKARAPPIKPKVFPIEAQAHALAGELAIESVSLGDLRRADEGVI
jgi:hypothetical protein